MNNNDQHSTRDTGRQSSRNKNADHSPNAEIKPQRDSDEVLGAIEGVERQLEALRGAHEEHRKLNAELAARRAQIDEMGDQVEAREAELAMREVELAEMRQELEDREAEIVQRASGMEQRESQMARHAETIEELEAVVETKSKQIDERVEELDKQLEGISVRKDELAKLEEQAKARLEQDSKLQVQIEALTEELENTKATLGGREIELKERAKIVEELAIQAGRLEKKMAEMAERSKNEESGTLRAIEEMQARLDEALAQIGTHEEAMSRALARIDELDAIASQRAEELNEAHALASQLQEQLQSIGSNASEELEASRSQIQALTAELAGAQEAINDAVAQRDHACEELESKLAEAIESGKRLEDSSGVHQNQIDELQAAIAQRDEQIAKIRAKYDGLSEQLLSEQQKAEEAQAQVSRMGELIDAASEREQTLMDDIKALNDLMENAQSEDTARTNDWTQSRRERLDRVKTILRQQSDKIRRATEALRDRYDQCEKVLLKRAELVDAYQAVAEAQSKLAKREARSGTLLGLSGLGLLLMMIAGISWFVAGQIAPGSYASRVTLVAKAGERSLTADDIASWQGYIEGLITDPQFVEQAAVRMKRRGIEELSVAGTLSNHMSQSLDIVSAEPGKMELEYRGDGASRTQRILDTYALTLTTQTNAARARRIDGALTTIESAASVGKSPLDTTRVETAGMIFGGSSLATFTFGGIFWRRLAKMKANFERDSRVEPLFDNESWEVEGRDA